MIDTEHCTRIVTIVQLISLHTPNIVTPLNIFITHYSTFIKLSFKVLMIKSEINKIITEEK